jgi:hypothetical protein
MIPKNTMYKLVNNQGIIIAEGNAKEMRKLKKKTPNTTIWISHKSKIGDLLDESKQRPPEDPFLTFANRVMSNPDKKNFLMNL